MFSIANLITNKISLDQLFIILVLYEVFILLIILKVYLNINKLYLKKNPYNLRKRN